MIQERFYNNSYEEKKYICYYTYYIISIYRYWYKGLARDEEVPSLEAKIKMYQTLLAEAKDHGGQYR